MLLVAGALTILSTVTLSINSSILQAYVVSYDSEATIDAISIGQAMVDEMQAQAFDSVTTGGVRITDPSQCTPPSRLGVNPNDSVIALPDVEPFRSQTGYDDVDDYNHYTRIVNSTHLGKFTVRDSVFYVLEGDLNTGSAVQTWYKKIFVTVSHPNLYRPVVVKSLMVFRKYIPPI